MPSVLARTPSETKNVTCVLKSGFCPTRPIGRRPRKTNDGVVTMIVLLTTPHIPCVERAAVVLECGVRLPNFRFLGVR